MTEATQRTSDSGVSIWLDDLSRTRIESGNLQELIKDKNVVGVTTNPSIFQKLLTEILSSCRIKIQGIRFIMDRTDIPYLRRTIFIHCCKCKDSYQFHLL